MVHTVAMLGTMGVLAVVVYEKVGLAVLRRAWLNFDVVWAFAMVLGGMVTLFS
jgi:hypothetical protein